jgi:hypothetical protein
MRTIVFLLLASAFLISADAPSRADVIPNLFSTGMADATTQLPDGAVDPHYTLVQVPPGAASGPNTYVVDSTKPPLSTGEWLANDAMSKWIAPQADQSTFSDDTGGNYVYRTTFDLTGFDPATAQIIGQWTVDNLGIDILLNGISTGNTYTDGVAFRMFKQFKLNSGFKMGVNALDFVVYNSTIPPGQEPSGLRVMIMTAEVEPEPSSFMLVAAGTLTVAGFWRHSRGVRVLQRPPDA